MCVMGGEVLDSSSLFTVWISRFKIGHRQEHSGGGKCGTHILPKAHQNYN